MEQAAAAVPVSKASHIAPGVFVYTIHVNAVIWIVMVGWVVHNIITALVHNTIILVHNTGSNRSPNHSCHTVVKVFIVAHIINQSMIKKMYSSAMYH